MEDDKEGVEEDKEEKGEEEDEEEEEGGMDGDKKVDVAMGHMVFCHVTTAYSNQVSL